MKYKVSVVVPAFNVERFIGNTLRSVFEQTLEGVELIIVYDENSTDNTIDEILRVSNHYKNMFEGKIKIIKVKGKGVSYSRNVGLRIAGGEYIFFLDGDDYINKHCLEKLYTAARKYGADITFCGFDMVDENGKKLKRYSDRFEYLDCPIGGIKALKLFLNEKIWLWTGSVLYHLKFLKNSNIMYNPRFSYGEDQLFNIICLYNAKVVYSVRESLSYYVQRKNASSKKITLRKVDYPLAMFEAYRYLRLHYVDKEILDYMEYHKIPLSIIHTLILFKLNGLYDEFKEKYDEAFFLKQLGKLKFRRRVIREYFAAKLFLLGLDSFFTIYRRLKHA